MFIGRRLPLRTALVGGLPYFAYAGIWSAAVVALYLYGRWHFLKLPFLPVGTIGTAVAFYVGFKNNAAYDRFWEARKIWGGVVNTSRTWANAVLAYVYEEGDQVEARRELIYRHLAWINALRLQLRSTSRYAAWRDRREGRYRWIREHRAALRSDWKQELSPFLSEEELSEARSKSNTAAQLLRTQGRRLRELFEGEQLDLFRQLELMKLIETMYALQGKCERIKKTPFPRQYAYFARIFVMIFIALVPFGLLDVFDARLAHITRLTLSPELLLPAGALVLSSALVAWVFMTMEHVGDYSEDPFERALTDVPMNAMCRGIEIDLREMLEEEEIPEPEKAVGQVLY